MFRNQAETCTIYQEHARLNILTHA